MGHRLDIRGVDFAQQVHVAQNIAQLHGHPLEFLFGKQQPAEQGDLFDLGAGQRHDLAFNGHHGRLSRLTTSWRLGRLRQAERHGTDALLHRAAANAAGANPAVRFVPLAVVIWIVCRLGRNVRREMPVTLVPTPPRYFALPRMVIWLPVTGLRPHTSQD